MRECRARCSSARGGIPGPPVAGSIAGPAGVIEPRNGPDRRQQSVLDPFRGDELRPGGKPQLHDGVEAYAPGLRLDFAIGRAREQRLEVLRPRRQSLADRVVAIAATLMRPRACSRE